MIVLMTFQVDSPGTVLIITLLDILALDILGNRHSGIRHFGIRHSGTFPFCLTVYPQLFCRVCVKEQEPVKN